MRKSLLSAVCAVSLAAAATLPSGSQARGITVAVGSSFTTLDPYQATDLLSRTVAKSFYEGLYSFDKNLKPVPQLAESYEVSEDGLVYTFKLRDGVKFHDGTDFTAEAAKLNFERVLNPDNHLSRRSFFNFIGRIEVVDRLHVKFVLSRRTPGFLQRLANGSGQMICPNTIKTMDGRGIAFNPCGTGPYLLKDYNPSERLVVVKNPNYRVKGLPKLDSITWLPVAENASRAAMLRTKEAAFIQPMPVEQVKDIENDPELKLNVVPSIMMRYLSINNAHKPFDDVRVRKAISLAINREALCKVAFSGYARPATGVLPLPIPSAVDLGVPKYDPQEAKRLLAEAGFPNGFSTKLWSGYNNSTSSKVIQFIQQQLAQVGIKAQVQALEAGQRVEKVESHQDAATAPVRLYYTGWSSSTGEADWGLRPLFAGDKTPPSMYNISYYKNPTVDADIMKALGTTDRAEKTKLYTEVQEEIWKDAPWAFLVTEKLLYATSKKLTGMYVMPDANYFFEEIDLQ